MQIRTYQFYRIQWVDLKPRVMKLSISVSSLKIAGCVIFFSVCQFCRKGVFEFPLGNRGGFFFWNLHLPKSDLEKTDKKYWRNSKNLVLPLFGEFCCARPVLST